MCIDALVARNGEAEPGQLRADKFELAGDEHECGIRSVDRRFNVSVHCNVASQAPRHTETFQQLNDGLEIAATTPQSQIEYFAGTP